MLLQVVHEEFGIVQGLMTTVHATTGIFSSVSFRVKKIKTTAVCC